MNALLLERAIMSAMKDEHLTEAFELIVERYYEDYEDADELDPEFHDALKTVFDVCFPQGEAPDGREFEEVIKKKENR